MQRRAMAMQHVHHSHGGQGGGGRVFNSLGGRMRVNKALHTCTSWYAYAVMLGVCG